MTYIRTLTDLGKKEFLTDLTKIKENPLFQFSSEKYNEAPFSNLFEPKIIVENNTFQTRIELGSYLSTIFTDINRDLLIDNEGLWNWLTIFWFDQLAPIDSSGKRTIGEFARYIYNPHYTRYYRHLVAASWDIYSKYKEKSKIFLQTHLIVTNQITRELACRQNLISNENLVDVILALYWHKRRDKSEGLKKDSLSKKVPGNLFRLITLMNQFEMTYDVFSMPEKDILDLLPSEFDRWKGITKPPQKKRIRDLFDISQHRLS